MAADWVIPLTHPANFEFSSVSFVWCQIITAVMFWHCEQALGDIGEGKPLLTGRKPQDQFQPGRVSTVQPRGRNKSVHAVCRLNVARIKPTKQKCILKVAYHNKVHDFRVGSHNMLGHGARKSSLMFHTAWLKGSSVQQQKHSQINHTHNCLNLFKKNIIFY